MAKSINPRNIEGTAEPEEDQKPAPVPTDEPDAPKTFAQMVGENLANMMVDRTAHDAAEKEMDAWFAVLPASRNARLGRLQAAREQIETARQAIEVLYMRFRTMERQAKN